jgi:hypothetical protein
LAGVTPTAKPGWYSDLNNIDVRCFNCQGMAPPNHYSGTCTTQKELPFCWHVDVHGTRSQSTEDVGQGESTISVWIAWFSPPLQSDLDLADLKAHYNSYLAAGHISVYNPVSIMSALKTSEIDNFWVATGLPTTIVLFN